MIKTFKDGTYEVIESIPGETILQFFSRVFGITYDKTMQEIDNGTIIKANKASNAKINKVVNTKTKNQKQWVIYVEEDYWFHIYPFSYSTREEARIMLKALKIWNFEKYRDSRIEKSY